MQWLFYVFLTVCTWGLYGVFLHSGQVAMNDPVFGRYKAFLFVGIAYFIFAVLAPVLLLKVEGSNFSFPSKGMWISLFAGALGAIGAFGILLAFGAKGTPQVVMSIVFAGAPVGFGERDLINLDAITAVRALRLLNSSAAIEPEAR